MKYLIDPTVDWIFKAILGSIENKNLLLHFLNSVLKYPAGQRILDIELLNPYSQKDCQDDKQIVLDVKAQDQAGHNYQIEMQVAILPSLNQRMLLNWSLLYKEQICKGQGYHTLMPTISIWILPHQMIDPQVSMAYHHHFGVYDINTGIQLNDHLNIHVLELNKWTSDQISNDEDYWLYFFKYGRTIDADAPPKPLTDSPIMRQAMDTLKHFSENEQNYHDYLSRIDYLRQQADYDYYLAQAMEEKKRLEAENQKIEAKNLKIEAKNLKIEAEKQKAEAEKQKAEAEKQKAETEKEQLVQDQQNLLALLKQHGIQPPHNEDESS